ncbi:MAG: 3-oxoacyl-[acyl-carrier-protein] reductase [Armatimonadetes bacterium]|nr:3-oxoacyl-[acyl-carrier-protein] reductase [Armatimonadota bacterium]
MRLQGRAALITGASRGIGRAIARRFAAEGCNVALNYVSEAGRDNAAEAEALAAEVRGLGRKALCLEADVTDFAAVQAMVAAAVEALGGLHILVNNAGITRDRTLRKLSPEDWQAVLDVNLTGAFNCAKAVLEPMLEQGYGRIISLASVVGLMGNFGQANYAASKAGLTGFSKSLAREVARKGVTVNCIAPGFIDTEMTRAIPQDVIPQILAQIPMGAMGTVEDVANAALFLASEEAGYITGQVLSVNGGMYM